MKFRNKDLCENDYCQCIRIKSVSTELDEFGFWDICCECGKPLVDGFHYYNHYDGEDHDDTDLY